MFRVRKHSGITSIPSDFNVDVPVIEVDKKGTRLQRVINVPISSIEDNIPSPDEYRLSDLLAAGVPLHPVSSNVEEYYVLAVEEIGVGADGIPERLADNVLGVVVLRLTLAEDVHVFRSVLNARALAHLGSEALEASDIFGVGSRRNATKHIVGTAHAIPFCKAFRHDIDSVVGSVTATVLKRIDEVADTLSAFVSSSEALGNVFVEVGCTHIGEF